MNKPVPPKEQFFAMEGFTIQGFTMVELLVTLAVAAVLMGFALPAMTNFLDQRTQTARINDFVLAVNYARSEAANLGTAVSIQAVDASDGDNEWGPGYCVVVGTPGTCAPPVTDPPTLLRTFGPMTGRTLNGTDGFDDVATLTFNSRGMLTLGDSGTLQLCSTDEEKDPGRELTVTLIGRAGTEDLTCH